MELLHSILQVAIWFLAIPLVILILLQGGAGDMSSTFGGGGQLDSTLGVGASRKMGKITAIMAIAFMVSVLLLNVPATGGSIGDVKGVQPVPAPAAETVQTPPAEVAAPAVETAAPPAVISAPPTEATTPPAEATTPPAEATAPPEAAPQPPAEAVAPPAQIPAPPAEAKPESKAAIDLGAPAETGN